MGCLQKCIFICQPTRSLILIILFFFMLSSTSHYPFLAEGIAFNLSTLHYFFRSLVNSKTASLLPQGRVIHNKLDSPQKSVREEKIVRQRYLIGSIPPRCDKIRCISCGHCEAVQVPIVPRIKHYLKSDHLQFNGTIPTIAYSRGDGITNYKPMFWKCKCGDYTFNP